MTHQLILPNLLLMVEHKENDGLPIRYPEFGQRLRGKMEEFGLSVADVKRWLGVTHEMARRYSLGQAMPRAERMDKLAGLVQSSPSFLAYGIEEQPDYVLRDRDNQVTAVVQAKQNDRRESYRRHLDDQLSPTVEDVVIREYDTGGAMGNGLVLDGMAGVIKSWRVDLEWVRQNVRQYSAIDNLCIVTGFGPSMRPMYNPGDPLLIDRGVTSFDREDAVYFFRVGDHGYIKTVQRIPKPGGGMIYRAKSKNPDYDPFDITEDMDFQVFGKVLTVWKSEQF